MHWTDLRRGMDPGLLDAGAGRQRANAVPCDAKRMPSAVFLQRQTLRTSACWRAWFRSSPLANSRPKPTNERRAVCDEVPNRLDGSNNSWLVHHVSAPTIPTHLHPPPPLPSPRFTRGNALSKHGLEQEPPTADCETRPSFRTGRPGAHSGVPKFCVQKCWPSCQFAPPG